MAISRDVSDRKNVLMGHDPEKLIYQNSAGAIGLSSDPRRNRRGSNARCPNDRAAVEPLAIGQ